MFIIIVFDSFFTVEVFLVLKLVVKFDGKLSDTLDSYNTLVVKNWILCELL